MAFFTEWDAIFNAVTGGVLALFGVWVWTLTPRSRRAFAIGLFAVSHGVYHVVSNGWNPGTVNLPGYWSKLAIIAVLSVVSAFALFSIAREILVDHGERGRAATRLTIWFIAIATVALTALSALTRPEFAPLPLLFDGILVAYFATQNAFFLLFGWIPLLLAWLYRKSTPGPESRLLLTLSVAFVLWPAMVAALGLRSIFLEPPVIWNYIAEIVLATATGLTWLLNTAMRSHEPRAARNAALLIFGILAFGAFDAAVLAGLFHYSHADGPFFGIARLATVVVLAHAILKHQVLGIDVKLRFALSKSTVAAVFIAVFFVASEGAQLMFGRQNELVGLVAAGALVFAMAPLQRAADRIALKALPAATQPETAATGTASDDLFRRALRIALADRRVTGDEELTLAELSERLGLGARRAVELRQEIERELRPSKAVRTRQT